MSGTCGNCDCTDQSQCVKKGYAAEVVETQSYVELSDVVMDALTAATEHNGGSCNQCKCGSNCSCTNCTCAH